MSPLVSILLLTGFYPIASAEPFYEDDTFILVVVIIGLLFGALLTVCICNYAQTEYDCCKSCRPCIVCLTCKCMSYEYDDQHKKKVPFDVSDKKKRQLAASQRHLDNQKASAFW